MTIIHRLLDYLVRHIYTRTVMKGKYDIENNYLQVKSRPVFTALKMHFVQTIQIIIKI